MVTNAPNFGIPAPVHIMNPIAPILLGMSQAIAQLNALDITAAKEVEEDRRVLVAALLQNHEAVAKLASSWKRAAAKKLAGESN